jgi:hypothetical protein
MRNTLSSLTFCFFSGSGPLSLRLVVITRQFGLMNSIQSWKNAGGPLVIRSTFATAPSSHHVVVSIVPYQHDDDDDDDDDCIHDNGC